MRIKEIAFHNYRCFRNGKIRFSEDNSTDRNINLILGPNGGGKTELLFSFRWALYDFDFNTLKGKEATPYALNSDLYRKLYSEKIGSREDCWVEVVIDDEGTIYHLRKTVVFVKTGNAKIEQRTAQTLSHELPNHERSLPTSNKREIELALNRIIPQSTLEGIIFDGERMQKLSRMDNDSKTIIRGVIRDVSNMDLLEMSQLRFKDARSIVSRRFQQSGTAKQKVQAQLEMLATRQEKAEEEIDTLTPGIEAAKDELRSIEARLASITAALEKGRKSRELARERRTAEETKKNAVEEQQIAFDDLVTTLNDSYLLMAEPLFKDVESAIEKCTVPEGLLAESIESILSGDVCICGEPLDEKHRANLRKLMEELPPNNINSTLDGIVRSLRSSALDIQRSAKSSSNLVRRQDEKIAKAEETIRGISGLLVQSDDEGVVELEKEKTELTKRQGTLERWIPTAEAKLKDDKAIVKSSIEKRKELAKQNIELKTVESQIQFYDKALSALKLIASRREEEALKTISEKLSEAYSQISEDAARGRRICLGRFSAKSKYQIIVYNENNYRMTYRDLLENGTIARWKNDASEEEIRERVILRCNDSNSTGQNKINTLAFVKAILDYSSAIKEESSFEVRKVYPLLIDAPFGDIFEDNLLLSSKYLYTFSDQIVLMLAEESYRSVESQLSSHVSSVTRLYKMQGKNESKIEIDGD